MSSAGSSSSWVSDRLLEVVGYSNATLCDFLVALSKKAASPAAMLHALTTDAGLAHSDALVRFATELHERIPKAGAGSKRKEPSADALAHKQAVAEVRKAKSFALVEEDEPMMAPAAAPKAPKPKPSKEERKEAKLRKKEKKKEKKLRKRMEESSSDSSSDSDDEDERKRTAHTAAASSSSAAASSSEAAAAAAAPSAELTEAELAELVREQDQAEKAEFEKRLAQREAERTKKLVGERASKQNVQLTEEEMKAMVPQIRERARQEYLKKREAQQLEFLRRSVADEEFLFGGANEANLTTSEREKLRKRRRVLELTTARQKLSTADEAPAYHMPAGPLTDKGTLDRAKKMEVLTKRYQDDPAAARGMSEQEVWEAHQTKSALMKFGAQGGGAGAAAAPGAEVVGGAAASNPELNEYVFDEAETGIEFVKQDLIAALNTGDLTDDASDSGGGDGGAESAAAQKSLSEFEQIQLSRKKLPIYPYKEEMMAAIEKYQVLIIVAETGSGKVSNTRTRESDSSPATRRSSATSDAIAHPLFSCVLR